MVCFIDWQPDVVALDLGFLELRWYSLMWCFGLLSAYLIVKKLYKLEGLDVEKVDPLFFYCFIGVLLGARLGHCIFYEPEQYLTSGKGLIEMFIPIRFLDNGDWKYTGFEGLASHGGTLGLIIAMVLYCRQMDVKLWYVLDFVGIASPFTSCFIRMGNLMNSEIVGDATDMPWGFVFHTHDALVNGELAPRHPAQLYEAIAYLIIGCVGLWLYKRWRKASAATATQQAGMFKASAAKTKASKDIASNTLVGTGFFFGYCLATIFTFRFFIEFLKKEQVDFEQGMLLDMGQLLSIPLVIVGVWCMLRSKKQMTK